MRVWISETAASIRWERFLVYQRWEALILEVLVWTCRIVGGKGRVGR